MREPAILRFSGGVQCPDRLTGCMTGYILLQAAVKAAAAWSIIAGQLKSRCFQNYGAAWLRQLYRANCQHVSVDCRSNRCSAVIWHNTAAGRPHHGLCYRQCQPPSHCCWYAPGPAHAQLYAVMTLNAVSTHIRDPSMMHRV